MIAGVEPQNWNDAFTRTGPDPANVRLDGAGVRAGTAGLWYRGPAGPGGRARPPRPGHAGARRNWLTVIQLPAYAPDLNPAEGVWANMKNGLGNLAAGNVDLLAAILRNRLKHIQYRPALINGFLAQTGLTLEPAPP